MTRISIHASRGGSDVQSACPNSCAQTFQSTLPAGEATINKPWALSTNMISIHASRGGSDLSLLVNLDLSWPFQSTLPAGEAT